MASPAGQEEACPQGPAGGVMELASEGWLRRKRPRNGRPASLADGEGPRAP